MKKGIKKGDSMNGNRPCPTRKTAYSRLYKLYPELNEFLVAASFYMLSSYKLGIHRKKKLLIRPKQARVLISRIRLSKPLIERVFRILEERGLLERNNQYIVVKKERII